MTSLSTVAMLFFLTTWMSAWRGITATGDLRCQCINTVSKPISEKVISSLEIISNGPYCPRVEVIVIFKNGNKHCLNLEAKWMKRIISNLLKRASRTEKPKKN